MLVLVCMVLGRARHGTAGSLVSVVGNTADHEVNENMAGKVKVDDAGSDARGASIFGTQVQAARDLAVVQEASSDLTNALAAGDK